MFSLYLKAELHYGLHFNTHSEPPMCVWWTTPAYVHAESDSQRGPHRRQAAARREPAEGAQVRAQTCQHQCFLFYGQGPSDPKDF